MTEEDSATGELRAAKARLKYWREEREKACVRGDAAAEAQANSFVTEYESFVVSLEQLRATE